MATKCGKLIRKTIVYDAELKGRISCLGGGGVHILEMSDLSGANSVQLFIYGQKRGRTNSLKMIFVI